MKPKVGIIGAMAVEVESLKKKLLPLPGESCVNQIKASSLCFTQGLLNGVEVVIVQSGVGKVNAALCAQNLILKFNVTHIINTGIAGAIGSGLKVLDFIVSKDALYHDVDATGFGYRKCEVPQLGVREFEADKNLIECVKSAFSKLDADIKETHCLTEGRIATGDQFISDRKQKEQIKIDCDPSCVEMEGAAIAHACYLNKIPFVIIRCLSDMADDVSENTYNFNEETAADLSASLVEKTINEFGGLYEI